MIKSIAFGLLLILIIAATGQASLIAEWNFDNGTASDSVGSADLAPVGGGHVISQGFATADGSNLSYHEATDPSDPAEWTVSLWVRTDDTTQGTFKGLFTNQTSSGAADSWQIDSNAGIFRVRSANANTAIDSPVSGVGSPVENIWQHVVIVKDAGGVELFIDGAGVGSDTGNPGDLANYRLAINRNSDNQYAGLYDTVQVYDSAEDAQALFSLGRHKIAKTRSWVLGSGGDTSGDAVITNTTGGTNFDVAGGAQTVSATGKRDVGFAFTGGATAIGGDAMFGASGTQADASIELWFNATNTAGKHILFETGGNGTGTSIFLDGSILTFQTQQGGSNVRTLTTDIAGLTDRFLQVLGVIDFTGGGAADLTLYLNGNEVDTDSFGSGFTDWAGTDGTGLGTFSGTVTQNNQTGSTTFDGQIGVLNYYNSALDENTVGLLYAARTIPAPAALPAGLLLIGFVAARRSRAA